MRNIRISLALVDKAVKEGWIKQLAWFYWLKFRFNNGCAYAHRSRIPELAKYIGKRSETLKPYLDVLRKEGLVREHCDNLILASTRTIRKGGRGVLYLSEEVLLKDIISFLYGKRLEKRGKYQARMESIRRDGIRYGKAIRRTKRGDRQQSGPCENPFYPSFSFRTIAKDLNISVSKAQRLMRRLEKLGFLVTHKSRPQLISDNAPQAEYYLEDRLGYHFNIGNKLYQQFGNRYEFVQCPIYLREISYKQFKAYHRNACKTKTCKK